MVLGDVWSFSVIWNVGCHGNSAFLKSFLPSCFFSAFYCFICIYTCVITCLLPLRLYDIQIVYDNYGSTTMADLKNRYNKKKFTGRNKHKIYLSRKTNEAQDHRWNWMSSRNVCYAIESRTVWRIAPQWSRKTPIKISWLKNLLMSIKWIPH